MTDSGFNRVQAINADVRAYPSTGWIQFKGTDLCMDVRCECGETSHIDGMFVYIVVCPACERHFHVSPDVRLVEATSGEIGGCEPKMATL